MALSVTVHGFITYDGSQSAGRWATADITNEDGADTLIWTVPANCTYQALAVSITNRAPSTASYVALAISDQPSPSASDFIESNASLVSSGVLERTQLLLASGDNIFVRWGTPSP